MGERRTAAEKTPPGAAGLITPALLLLVLVGYVAAWIAAWVRNPFQPDGTAATLLYTWGQVLAVAAPLLWAGAVLWLARTDRGRLLGLLLGVLVLAPVPLVIGAT